MSAVDKFRRHRDLLVAGAGLALALVAWTVLGRFYLGIMNQIVVLALFGVAFNLAFGFADLPSFGHAAYYGLGAYGVALGLQHFPETLLVPVLITIVAAGLYSVIVGYISTRGAGIYFALLTFAFAQFLYEVALRWSEVTNGEEGIIVSPPDLPFGVTVNIGNMFLLGSVVLVLTYLFGRHVTRTPLGKAMQAIKHNEQRADAIGYPVRWLKITVFVISSVLASLAGVLFALSNFFVTPSVLFFEVTLDALIVSIIGGVGFVGGPIVGAVFLVLLEELTRDYQNLGHLAVGVTFILVIFFIPEGILGAFYDRVYDRLAIHAERFTTEEPEDVPR
jgi:branched-chain amino acid transport system permease protein